MNKSIERWLSHVVFLVTSYMHVIMPLISHVVFLVTSDSEFFLLLEESAGSAVDNCFLL